MTPHKHPVQALCRECALQHSAKPPKNYPSPTHPLGQPHIQSRWTDACDVCNEVKPVTPLSDYHWPMGRPTEWIECDEYQHRTR